VSGGGLSAGGAGGIHGTHAEEGRGGKDDWDFGEMIELSGRVFENTRDLAGDLLRAKNAGVTLEDQASKERPNKWHPPEVLLQSTRHLTKSESE
jgi:hypothetical protein